MQVKFENFSEISSESDGSDEGEEQDDVVMDLGCEALDRDEELRLHVMGLSSYWTRVIESNWASNIKLLPSRWLPPGNIRMLYLQMKAEQKGMKVSYQTFWKTFRHYWGKQLRFLAPSTHGTCDLCCSYKTDFRACRDPQTLFELCKYYKMHLNQVGADRELEEYLQVQDPLKTSGAALAIHWDPGM